MIMILNYSKANNQAIGTMQAKYISYHYKFLIVSIEASFHKALIKLTASSVCLSRIPTLFAEDEFLSLDFATNTLVNHINSFHFYAIAIKQQIMQ